MNPFRTMLRSAGMRTKHVSPVRPESASGVVAEVYRQTERDFGMLAPPITLHSPSPELLAAAWCMLRETLLVPGFAGRAAKERIATAVSEANSCPYCVAVHGSLADALPASSPSPHSAPVAEERPEVTTELTAVATTFHYLNRMVNVFLDDSPLPRGAPRAAIGMLGRVLRSRSASPPGESLALLPPSDRAAELPSEGCHERIAETTARAHAVIERAGKSSVPIAVRDMLHTVLPRYDSDYRMNFSWLQDCLTELRPGDRPAGRLALLTALESYRVDERTVLDYRATGADDAALIELTAWAAYVAARHGNTPTAG
ncbi:alkylhydroperoxidase AhpD family core domain-containing protein [Actinopolyspora mzabensis]|uniref:Alkylhydroperoxidase AhpD family core domain-containing protein n=1 Tax=Actinopolyspora mzabensis TaxID=995066 RepID=A0A1G8Y6D6_ACTMZ|nr:carboxymuconolactone decarboxylase family protein [Actinopolyspora mzabensis]SDJ97650.1 alkylhydroperoxidase AhpD family core domain-containing protein [Actinopolyspora mzabensis]